MTVSAKRFPPHRNRPRLQPVHPALARSPILYPFPQYLLPKRPGAGARYRCCLFCGFSSTQTQRKFLMHAVTRIIRPGSQRYTSGLKRYLACWELANRKEVDYVVENGA